MSTVQEIEKAIVKLPANERMMLRTWFDELDATACDQKLEDAIDSGFFDNFAKQARQDFKDGKCAKL